MNRKGGWALGIAWGLAVLTGMGATAYSLRNAVNNAFFLRSAGVSQRARSSLQELLDRQARDLGTMAEEMSRGAAPDETSFQEKAVRLLRDAPLFATVAFINDAFRREWVFPFSSSGRAALGTELKNPSDAGNAARRSIETGRPAASGPVDLLYGGTGVLLYAPVFQGRLWKGLVEGPLPLTRVAVELIDPSVGRDFRTSIIDERQGREIYSNLSQKDRTLTPAYDAYFTLLLADRTWWVLLHPQAPPPTLAIVAGALSAEAIIGALLYYLWRRRP